MTIKFNTKIFSFCFNRQVIFPLLPYKGAYVRKMRKNLNGEILIQWHNYTYVYRPTYIISDKKKNTHIYKNFPSPPALKCIPQKLRPQTKHTKKGAHIKISFYFSARQLCENVLSFFFFFISKYTRARHAFTVICHMFNWANKTVHQKWPLCGMLTSYRFFVLFMQCAVYWRADCNGRARAPEFEISSVIATDIFLQCVILCAQYLLSISI